MKVDHELKVIKVDGKTLPVFIVSFNEPDLDCIEGFHPAQVLIEDRDKNVALTDNVGHEYMTIPKNQLWISAAMQAASFVLSLKMPTENGDVLGRVLVVAYPFGQVVSDSGVFSASEKEIELARLMGRGVVQNAGTLLSMVERRMSTLPQPN